MPSAWSLYAIDATSVVANTVIDQIQSQEIDPGIEELLEGGDGHIDAEHISVSRQRPLITFTTTALKTALGFCGLGGKVIDLGANPVAGPLDLYFRKRAAGSVFAAATEAHLRLRIDVGLMYCTGIRATHPEAAQGTFAILAIYDPDPQTPNDPVQIMECGAQDALPTLAPSADGVWTVGPWWINGTEYDYDTRDFTLTPGIELGHIEGAGQIWPVSAYFSRRAATMEATFGDLGMFNAVGLSGIARSGVTRAFLRRKAAGAALVADATAEHIRFDMAEGRITPTQVGGAHQGDLAIGLSARATWDQSNDPIAVATAVAVSGS